MLIAGDFVGISHSKESLLKLIDVDTVVSEDYELLRLRV